MSHHQGTPKSLKEAIRNGCDDAKIKVDDAEIARIQVHVVDYLAQKFSTALILEEDPHISVLWERITGRKI